MKRNVNVFIGVVLCAVLCGCFVWLSTVSEDDAWSPNEIYNEIVQKSSYSSSYTNATFAPSSGDGLALSMGSSSLSRARKSVSYAGAHGGAVTTPLTSNLSPITYTGATAGAGMHLTSNAQLKSFGGGGNAVAMGGQSSVSNRPSTMAGGAGVAMSISSPITYTAARTNNVALADPATASSDELMAVMAANYGMGGYTSSFYGSSLQGTYGQYAGVYGSSNSTSWGISGRRNSSGISDSWYEWFHNWWIQNGNGSTGDVYVTEEDLYKAWLAFCENWNSTMGGGYPDFSFDDWKDCFMNNNDGNNTFGDNSYYWAPVGDLLPLVVMALIYLLVTILKSVKPITMLKLLNKKH